MIYDVAIIGAGPAGSTCALALRGKGLKVALLDKHQFPRDKVCGDAIPAMCGRILQEIDPKYRLALDAFPKKSNTRSCLVVGPGGGRFEYHFKTGGWCSPRLDFDNLLLNFVLEDGQTHFLPGNAVETIKRHEAIWEVGFGNEKIQAKLIVGADGANGICAKKLSGQQLDADHHCAAVRQYFQRIKGIEDGRMEIHLVKDYLPGYFWIFPVGEGRCNVGFGMMRKDVAKRKISLRNALPELIGSTPSLRERFEGAMAEGSVQGFGLPMGSRKVPMSGDGFLLCGDAAALVEPATGEGIGNAMFSGWSAAQVVQESLKMNDFSAEFLKRHDEQVYGKLWKGMHQKHLAQKYVGGRALLLDILLRLAGSPGPLRWLTKKIF